MKQVWLNRSSWAWVAATTSGWAWPMLITAMPEPMSISWLPSTSTRIAPSARSTKAGRIVPTPGGTAAVRRASISLDRGPGTSVTSLRSCVTMRRSVGAARTPGMTTLFVHGVPETAAIWDRVRGLIDRESSALRLPGFGIPRPDEHDGTMDAYVEWLLDEIRVADEPVDIVGHDWGGIL